MEKKLLLFIYSENKFSKYQIVADSDNIRESIDIFNKSDSPLTAKIILDEDVRQALFQKESLETVKGYVDSVHEGIREIKDDLDSSFDSIQYSFNDFYKKVKDYLNVNDIIN